MRKMFNAYYKGEGENPIEPIQRGFSSSKTASKRNSSYVKSQLEKQLVCKKGLSQVV